MNTSDLETRISTLESAVRDLKSQHEIRATLSRYAIGVDDKRPEVLRAIFTADASLRIPEWNIAVQGIQDVMGFYDYYWGRFDFPRRYYANEEILVNGDQGTAFMYWHVTQERNAKSVLGWGTYEWGFRRESGQWRISSVVINLRAMTTLSAGWAGSNKFTDA